MLVQPIGLAATDDGNFEVRESRPHRKDLYWRCPQSPTLAVRFATVPPRLIGSTRCDHLDRKHLRADDLIGRRLEPNAIAAPMRSERVNPPTNCAPGRSPKRLRG